MLNDEMSAEPLQQLIDEVYENIPDVVERIATNSMPTNDEFLSPENLAITSHDSKNNESQKLPKNNLMNHKDALYATPLRKSDRNRLRRAPGYDGEKISNLNHQNINITNDPDLKNLMERTFLNSELGENRIKDFLKDTAHMHKRMEPPGKEHIGSSFSYLARKEHFVNLVNQNVLKDQNIVEEQNDLIKLDDSIEPCENLEETEKLINKLVEFQAKICSQTAIEKQSLSTRLISTNVTVDLNREWVLKKIAMSLEQKALKKLPPTLPETVVGFSQQQLVQNSSLPVVGYLVLGSNGSGKTTICNDIINGTNGTKGMLNRRLISYYYVNSQNPNCHSLSVFIRNMVLQILSFSSLWNKSEAEASDRKKKEESIVDHELEEMILSEIKLNLRVTEFCQNKSKIIRQLSTPVGSDFESDVSKYTTHPPLHKKDFTKEEADTCKTEKNPNKKSKIPVKIGQKPPKSSSLPIEGSNESDDFSIPTGGGEGIADVDDQKLEEDIANELREATENDASKQIVDEVDFSQSQNVFRPSEDPNADRPPPLPKLKDCRTVLADAYFIMLQQNPEIFESLIVCNIEKNPDDCFKKAILFPLLEICPPKSAQLMLIDSIDENYLNDGTLITTLNKKNNTRSRNIAELLSSHIHLLPKWLFLVCTAKKQNKHITKLFSGFKKLTLDDLRKSHVVKDVQQYIINRLNIDFRGINLNKEIIDSLNQLYIKSNGCLLYLQKVMTGIKENFFTFREIKLIPCTLYGLFLYLCQKSFNKKQYTKIRPILNILLACTEAVDKNFVFNCLKAHNYAIDYEEYGMRLELMKNILQLNLERNTIKIFHNSFSEWLIDVKFSTKKFLCDPNEGHLMIAMFYTLTSDQLCPNKVREYIYHLIKSAEHLSAKNSQLDILLILLESKANLSDCFYTDPLSCCKVCEGEFQSDLNQAQRTRKMIQHHLDEQLTVDFTRFLSDFFKPSLPTDTKVLKLLMETGINNLDSQFSCESSMMNSPLPSDKSQTIDSELAELLISSEKSCMVEQKASNIDATADDSSGNENSSHYERIDVEMHKGKAFIHILANDGNHVLMERALKACKGRIEIEIEDQNGQTALNIAARNGHIEIVKLLLEYFWVS